MQDYPQIVTSRRLVPNTFPSDTSLCPYRIAIIGEAPGEVEENYLRAFVGPSGNLLNSLLQSCGIDRNKIFVGNICQVRPPRNEISLFDWSGPEIQSGLAQLKHDLDLFQPNICVLLGNTPLRAARQDPSCKISDWSGSLFLGMVGTPFAKSKCIPSFHPAGVLRFWGMDGNFPRLKAALSRAVSEAGNGELVLPQRELIAHYDCQTLCHIMDEWPSGQRCSVDIEGGLPNACVNDGVRADSKKRRYIGWRCVAISARPTRAFAIAWWKFDELQHARLLQSFARLMSRNDVPKVLQNSLYDSFVMAYGYGIHIANVTEDTMLKGWEVYCELPKSLSVQASIYTREPHWKDEEMYETTGEALAIGCCRDTAVTIEICQAQDGALTKLGEAHYRTNVEMERPALYMELRGIKYDQIQVNRKKKEVYESGWSEIKDGQVVDRKSLLQIGEEICQIAKQEVRGAKGSLSSQRLAKVLYTELGYEPQFKKENGRKTEKFTTDVEAILHLQKKLPSDLLLRAILEHRHLEGLLETLNIVPDSDGRVRCSYNVVGTETGRFSCKTSPTGSGANLTTITKTLRSNYIADADYHFFQCDLSGADGWTVAAHCARLGDQRMLLDYFAGLKPAKIIAGLYCFGSEFNSLDTESLSFWGLKKSFGCISNQIGQGVYDSSKMVQHGTNYLMGIPTMQKGVMIKTFKETGTPTYLDFHDGRTLQNCYLSRYPGLSLWHNWAQATLIAKGELTSASGQTRTFFGRRFGKDIHDTVKEFLAHEPQSNTTWSTNLAMLNLWKDPANRVAKVDGFNVITCDNTSHYWAGNLGSLKRMSPGSLLIEPLHQVHDALCGQFPKFLTAWAAAKIRSYFDNTLTIAGTEIVIPFEGTFGPSWGEMRNVL